MKVKRTTKINTDSFEIGDVIKFKLTDGEKVQAMAVKQTPEGMLFVLVDCLAKAYPMFNDIGDMDEEDISYATSDLRKALNGEILDRFPKEIKDRMVAVNAEGDMLRIPTECEIFGENVYGQEESKLTKRWKPMKKKRNRIAFQGKEGALEWYWLMNRHKDYASTFAGVYDDGNALYYHASNSRVVRPVFMLSNKNNKIENELHKLQEQYYAFTLTQKGREWIKKQVELNQREVLFSDYLYDFYPDYLA